MAWERHFLSIHKRSILNKAFWGHFLNLLSQSISRSSRCKHITVISLRHHYFLDASPFPISAGGWHSSEDLFLEQQGMTVSVTRSQQDGAVLNFGAEWGIRLLYAALSHRSILPRLCLRGIKDGYQPWKFWVMSEIIKNENLNSGKTTNTLYSP